MFHADRAYLSHVGSDECLEARGAQLCGGGGPLRGAVREAEWKGCLALSVGLNRLLEIRRGEGEAAVLWKIRGTDPRQKIRTVSFPMITAGRAWRARRY
jgi:hypothetical protein